MLKNPSFINKLHQLVDAQGIVETPEDMASYLEEERGLYSGNALAVLRPCSTEQVSRIVGFCAEHNIPITPQGGNTGLCGGAVPDGGILLSLGRLNAIRSEDPLNMTITAEAGCVLATIQEAASRLDCLFPLSLGAEGSCQIGGNLATNAGGNNVLRYGNARDLVLGLEVVLADGRVWEGLRGLRKDNRGYDLKHIFMGSEGTLGIITAATLRLFPKPKSTATALIAMNSMENVLNLFDKIKNTCGEILSAFEFISQIPFDFALRYIDGTRDPFAKRYPFYVLIELTSSRPDDPLTSVVETVLGQAFEQATVEDAVIAATLAQAKEFWHIREHLPAAQKMAGGSIKHDISVPVSAVPVFLDQAARKVEQAMPGIRVCAFGHLGDGNIHYNLSQPENSDKQAFLDKWSFFNGIIHDLINDMGGSFSAEHGIGKLKTGDMEKYLPKVEIDLMRTLKATLDPAGILNPGKVLEPGPEAQT